MAEKGKRFILYHGDCRAVMAQLFSMNVHVLCSRKHCEIGKCVVKSIMINMVNYIPLFHRSMMLFPFKNSSHFPYVWVRNFDMGAFVSTMIDANSSCSYRNAICRLSTRLVFGIWRQMQTFHAFIPWSMSEFERVGRGFSGTEFVSNHPRLWYMGQSSFRMPFASTLLRTESSCFFSIRTHQKLRTADLTYYGNHKKSIAGTTGIVNGDLMERTSATI